jgi:beta-lactamase regulating signal transducer with metallopeptidase domain
VNLLDTSGFLAALGRVSAQAGVLVVLVLLTQRVFRKQLTARWRCALWMLVIVRLLLPVSFASVVSVFNLAPHLAPHWTTPRPAPVTSASASAPVVSDPPRNVESPPAGVTPVRSDSKPALHDVSANGNVIANNNHSPATAQEPVRVERVRSISWPWVGFAVWLAGVLALSVYVLLGSIRISRHIARLKPLTDASVLNVLDECRERLDVRATLIVVESPMVGSPALHGFLRPRLVLPRGFTGAFSATELRFVLLHELAHVKRRDILVNWIVAALQIAHWFNPLVWLGFNRWRADRELACDALALEAAGPEQNREYGKTILRLLEGFTYRVAAPGLVGILEDKRQLRRRIGMIAAYVPARRWSMTAIALIIGLAITCLTDAQSRKADTDKSKNQIELSSVSAPARLVVTNGPSMKVIVLDADTGKPLAGAEVLAPNFASFGFTVREDAPHWITDENGVAVIRLGERHPFSSHVTTWFTVSARHKGYAPQGHSWSATQTDVRPTMPEEATFRLQRGITVGGVVQDEKRAPLAGIRVRIIARGYDYARGNQLNQEYQEYWSDVGVPSAITDAAGRWRVADFPADVENVGIDLLRADGTVAKFVHSANGADSNPNDIQGGPFDLGSLRQGDAHFMLTPGLTLTGVVVDPTGRPVPGVLIKTGYGAGNRQRGLEVRTDANGRFKLEHLTKRQTVLTAYPDQFAITSAIADLTTNKTRVPLRGDSTAAVELTETALVSEIRLILAAQRTLTIRVVDGHEKPIAGARIDADEYRSEGYVLDFTGRTDADGVLMWSNAPISGFAVNATVPNSPLRQKIRVLSRQDEIRFRLREGMNAELVVGGIARDSQTGDPIKLDSYKFRTADREPFHGITEAQTRATGSALIGEGTNAEAIGMSQWVVDGQNKLNQQWFWYGTNSGFALPILETAFRPGMYPSYQLELKAKGYETLVTSWRDYDEGDWIQDFTMDRLDLTKRTVVLPDGHPGGGVQVWARSAATDGFLFCNDANRYYGDRLIQKKTDPQGQIETISIPDDQPVMFTHPYGFLEMTGGEFKRSSKIQLEPWGEVRGVLKVAGQPKRDAQVLIVSEWTPDEGFHLLYITTTAPDGSFSFKNVPAGNYRLFREMASRSGRGITEDHPMPISVKPGEVLMVEYGSTGRKVMGQAIADKSELAVNWLNDDHTLRLKQPPLPSLNFQDFATSEAYTKAYNATSKSPERLKQMRDARTYVLQFEADGSFQAEDVPPGTYELRINVTKPVDRNSDRTTVDAWGNGVSLGTLVREIVVPEGKGPFDLGMFTVAMKNDGSTINKTPALELAAQTFDGRPRGLADFRGKNLLLVFWAAWSDRSAEQLAEVQKLHAEFAKEQRLAMLSVNLDDDLDAARQTVNARHYQWPQAWASPENRAKTGASFDVNSLPTVVLLDPQGRVIGRDLQGDRLHAAVERALAKK